MQKFNKNLITICCLLLGFSAFAQPDRYLKEVFSDVKVTPNVVYGVNTTLLFQSSMGRVKQPLHVDIYEPMDDTNDSRPFVLLLHTGNFLPRLVNGSIQGTRVDSSAVEIATRLAKMGYVVGSAEYRLGWNPGASTQPLRALGLIQAAYRGIQDARSCVRYFRDDAANADLYKIDPDKIAVWGNGTGGYIGLGMATLDNYNEILTTTMPQGKFFFDHDGDQGTADIPMVNQIYHGNINGDSLAIVPADGFGYETGDTSCFANTPGYSSDIQLMINIGGALGDISWLDGNSAPIISFHHHKDQFAPYESDVLKVPGSNLLIVEVQGSKLISETQDGLGNNDPFQDANISDVYTSQATTNAGIAGHPFTEALYPVVNPVNAANMIEGVVVDWWDPEAIDPNPLTNPNQLPWNQLPNLLADPGGSITFHQSGQATNIGMSAAKARTNIDTLIGFFAPRAYAVLDLVASSTDNITADQVNFELAPNPVSNSLNITSDINTPIKQVRIFDINGRLLRHYDAVNSNKLTIERGNIPSGMHVILSTFEAGNVAQKVLFD